MPVLLVVCISFCSNKAKDELQSRVDKLEPELTNCTDELKIAQAEAAKVASSEAEAKQEKGSASKEDNKKDENGTEEEKEKEEKAADEKQTN